MLAQPTGVAPGEAAQSRGDGVGSGSSRRKPSKAIGSRGGLFLLGTATATGEIPERRLWAEKHAPSKWFLSCIVQQAPQGRTGAIEEALHPGAFASRIVIFADRFRQRRNRRCHARTTGGDAKLATLITSLQLAVVGAK